MTYLASFDGVLWLVAALVALVLLQRALHREIQAFFLILTQRAGVTQVVFALIFLPGVFLHELSHLVTAKILGVRTGRFSLIPKAQPNGRLRLGYVETAPGDIYRDTLIGFAPLVSGCLVVAFIAATRLDLLPLWEMIRQSEWGVFWTALEQVPNAPDFWLWFYLAFTISSTMMPSASDRQAWLPVGILIFVLVVVAILAGAGPWMLVNLGPPVNNFLQSSALIFGLSSMIHAILLLPFFLLHTTIVKIKNMDV